MKKVIKKLKLLLVIGMIIVPVTLMAQDDPGGGFGDPFQDVPFDGGISLLVATGVAYGIKKVYDKKKEEKDEL